MKTFRLFSMAALALVMAACSSEDNALENATPVKPGLIPFSATVAPLSGATTRTEYTEVTSGDDAGKINVAWKKGDQIFIARLTPDLGTAGRVTVGEPNGDGSAPLSGDISGADGNEIEAYYPASAYDDWGIFSGKYIAQDGTLSGIQDNLDYRKGTGKISVIDGKATLATALQMESQIAIWKLTLQNTSGANLNATKVTIKDGSDIIAATKDISATSEVHMAVPLDASPTTFSNLTIEATTADGTYTYAAPSAVNLSHSTYYQSTVKMVKAYTLAESTVGMIVGSDGKAYAAADKDNLPSGVTAVAMVAYKSETAGESLAIQLNASPASMSWSDACNYSGYPSITGNPGTWRLPSKADWQNMFVGCAKSGDADASDSMSPIAGFNEKIGATGITWKSDRYWSSTDSGSVAWSVIVNLDDSPAYASFGEGDTSNPSHVLGCLAF